MDASSPTQMPNKPPSWVGQADKNGCAVACLAMLTKTAYWKVARYFSKTELWDEGIAERQISDYLAEVGYAVRRLEWESGRKWPPKPFADVHIAMVLPIAYSEMAHCVVWLRDGTVLDPGDPLPGRISDYFAVQSVIGATKLD